MAQAFTVLFVDDDDAVRAPIARLLQVRGLRVLAASSAVEAIRILAQEHVDVLFTDLVMPDVNGIELAKQAKQLQPGIQVMFATGYFSRAAEATELGKVLFKPVRGHQIEAAIEDIWASRESRPLTFSSYDPLAAAGESRAPPPLLRLVSDS